MSPTRYPAAYRLWRAVRLSRGGRALARARAARLTPTRLARHAAAALSTPDPSHAGEFGHLSRLLDRLGLGAERFAVDLAAGDGVTGSCTLPLFRDRGWEGVAIECDAARHTLLAEAYGRFPRVKTLRRRVTPANSPAVLHGAGVPEGFPLLNLDIDSFDLEVACEVAASFLPLVIDLEVNEKVPPPIRFAVRYSEEHAWDEGHCYGCSLAAAADLLVPLGYRLEGLEYNNAFFVRSDLAAVRGIVPLSVEEAYASGYAGRVDRLRHFPWNVELDVVLTLPAAAALDLLRRRFGRSSASFTLQLEPLSAGWAGRGEAE